MKCRVSYGFIIVLLFTLVINIGCLHHETPNAKLIQKLKGDWVEVKRTNIKNSSFDKNFGNFLKPQWNLTITDSNELSLRIKDSSKTLEYPYGIFYDSILVLGSSYYDSYFIVRKINKKEMTLVRIPINEETYPSDTIIYYFLSKNYYDQLTADQKNALTRLTKEDTLYVLDLIHGIIYPDKNHLWYDATFAPEIIPKPIKYSKNITVRLSKEYLLEKRSPIYEINVQNTSYDTSFGYDKIDIDTSGHMYIGGYAGKLMEPLFRKYVQHFIIWNPAKTLGHKQASQISANIHYYR